jgi:hypothetical protein
MAVVVVAVVMIILAVAAAIILSNNMRPFLFQHFSLSLNISGQPKTLLQLKLIGILTINLFLT